MEDPPCRALEHPVALPPTEKMSDQPTVTVTHTSSWGVWGRTIKGLSNGANESQIYDQLKGTFGGQIIKHDNGTFEFRAYD